MPQQLFHHVDVFTDTPFAGNSLTVFPNVDSLDYRQMLLITQELRHFETIFLRPVNEAGAYPTRIFDLSAELDFAGHPLLGAASVLHRLSDDPLPSTWKFALKDRTVTVRTEATPTGYRAGVDQGEPEFLPVPQKTFRRLVAAAINLDMMDLSDTYPLQVVSTGLRYLIIPIESGLAQARIVDPDFQSLLAAVGAQFAYVLDVVNLEGRHWNNDGGMEDIATGSAAGTVGAYLFRHGRVRGNKTFELRQGRFAGRPSVMQVLPETAGPHIRNIKVSGSVTHIATGALTTL
jgi:trans-2,3-dihydro-3-hydroxyanthranilate isomerase